MSSIEYAKWLDYEQQLDYEEELLGEQKTLEEQELDEFKERCRHSKVSATKLMKYEKELTNATMGIKQEIEDIKSRIRFARGKKLLEKELVAKSKKLEAITQQVYKKYFNKNK